MATAEVPRPDYDEDLLHLLYDTVSVHIVSHANGNYGRVTFDYTVFGDLDKKSIEFVFAFNRVIQNVNIAFHERPVGTNVGDPEYRRSLACFNFSYDNDRAYNKAVLEEISNVCHLLRSSGSKRMQTFYRFLLECIPYIRSGAVELGLV